MVSREQVLEALGRVMDPELGRSLTELGMVTVTQMLPRSALVLVTTPQRASVQVASRAGAFARRANQEILGVVENMSYFVCPGCGRRSHVFGRGGGEELARHLGVPFLGEIPLTEEIRSGSSGPARGHL